MRTALNLLVTILSLGSGAVLAADPPPDAATRLELARQKLDAAAREFAELHRELGVEPGTPLGPAPLQDVVFERRGMLGIVLGPLEADGVRVIGVTPGSGAQAAGLVAGDVILAIDGAPVAGSMRNLHQALASPAPGDVVAVEYERAGQKDGVDVTVSAPRPFQIELPDSGSMHVGVMTATAAAPPFIERGLELHDVDENLGRYFGVSSGVLVLQAAADSGLEAGDILVSVADVKVRDAADAFGRLLNSANGSAVTVLRDGTERSVDFVSAGLEPPDLASGPGSMQEIQVFRRE